jgi:hypothetical protein
MLRKFANRVPYRQFSDKTTPVCKCLRSIWARICKEIASAAA